MGTETVIDITLALARSMLILAVYVSTKCYTLGTTEMTATHVAPFSPPRIGKDIPQQILIQKTHTTHIFAKSTQAPGMSQMADRTAVLSNVDLNSLSLFRLHKIHSASRLGPEHQKTTKEPHRSAWLRFACLYRAVASKPSLRLSLFAIVVLAFGQGCTTVMVYSQANTEPVVTRYGPTIKLSGNPYDLPLLVKSHGIGLIQGISGGINLGYTNELAVILPPQSDCRTVIVLPSTEPTIMSQIEEIAERSSDLCTVETGESL